MRIPLRWSIGLAIASVALISEAQIASPGPRSTPSGEIVTQATSTSNAIDARIIQTWSNLRTNQYEAAGIAGDQLLRSEPNNSLGLVAIAAANWQTHADEAMALSCSKRALRFANELQRPASMSDEDFTEMTRTVRALADHIAGDVYRMRGDYISARKYLKESVALEPSNGEYAYTAALGYLNGKNADTTTGFWLLARSVNLTRNEPDGKDVAAFARQAYQQNGGSSDHWDRYVASAAASSAPPIDRGSPSVEAARANQPVPPQPTPPSADVPTVAKSEPVIIASARPPDSPDRTPMKVPDLPPEPKRDVEPLPERKPLKVFRQGAPMSLGIVIEASIASKQNRSSVVYTLSDMVRGLRETDEAFVESYGDKVTFGQDLTWNYELLEQAMDQISPDRGTSLLDAVSFAANHLRRIAKNENRVLFVISDGSENGKQQYYDNAQSLINNSGVRIVCLGIGVSDPAARDRLRELASTTGGQVMFIDNPGEFRSAAHQIASAFGLHFQE